MANRVKKESILDLNKYLNKSVHVKFSGGRDMVGILKGYDALLNLVLDECVETLADPADPFKPSDETRKLGLVVCRGNQISVISPLDGTEEIENPWATAGEQI